MKIKANTKLVSHNLLDKILTVRINIEVTNYRVHVRVVNFFISVSVGKDWRHQVSIYALILFRRIPVDVDYKLMIERLKTSPR